MTTAAIVPVPSQDITKCNTIPAVALNNGIGLLTTVAQLPAKYKIRYLARATMVESPLDLTVKQEDQLTLLQQQQQQHNSILIDANTSSSNIVSIASTNKNLINNSNNSPGPITPPPSPPKKRYRDLEDFNVQEISAIPAVKIQKTKITTTNTDQQELVKSQNSMKSTKIEKGMTTPSKPIRRTTSPPKTSKSHPSIPKEKKSKAIRKLKFDEDTSSPVSGTIIRTIEEILENSEEHQSGDIDPQYNIVEITDEAKSELAAIKNVIGAYICKLCRIEFDDAFGLAQHRCSCIVLLEYRCPECGKRFNCPANLASHRRWHKPKEEVLRKQQECSDNEQQFPCDECGKQFKRQAYLRKHLATHKQRSISNDENQQSLMKIKKKSSKLDIQNGNSRTTSLSSSVQNDEIISNTSTSISMNNIGGGEGGGGEEEEDLLSIQSTSTYHRRPNSGFYNDNRPYKYDSDLESRSDCSSPGRLQIIENNLTEEENIAAAALAHLRNGPSVIQHTQATTMAF